MFRRFGVFVVLATFAAASSPLWNPLDTDVVQDVKLIQLETNKSYRLPNNTRPLHYDLHLTTHIHTQTNFNFSGVVAIRFIVVNASRTITLHHRKLTIDSASLTLASNPNEVFSLNAPEYDSVVEHLTLTLTSEELIENCEYILTINYNGIHHTDNAGFHRSSYVAADGSTRWLASTHFEQTDARRAFPCYDEPGLRALYSINITHGSIYHALSNMPILSKIDHSPSGYTTTSFQVTTAPVPTYLVAFIVSDFESLGKTNERRISHRIFARPKTIQNGHFALDVGVKALDAFAAYFGIDFALPKIDQVAIPHFPPNAMENWGLVFYQENVLLFDESQSTFMDLRSIVTITVHEFAHQWFGNLVTPKWWTYNWMKEGFATLYSHMGTDWQFPEWNIFDAFVFEFTQIVMVPDGTSATRPMTHYVESPAELSSQFDMVAYMKSACVLNMLMHAFTEPSFSKGTSGYLKLKIHTDGVEEELFAELEKAVKADRTLDAQHNVATIFFSWTRQAGYPIVTVERNYANGEFSLHQERYLAVNESTPSTSIWWIPFNTATGSTSNFSDTTPSSWFHTRQTTIKSTIPLLNNDWLLLNKRQTGYYRVKYDAQNYKLLSDALVKNFSQIHLTSRSQLIDDAFDLARTNRLNYDVAFDFIKYLEHELEYVPWASAFQGLEYVDRLYAGNDEYPKFAKYLVKQMAFLYQDAGLVAKPNEHHYRKQARNQVVQWSCRLGSEQCLIETGNSVNDFLTRNVAIHQDHRATVLCNGMRTSNETQFKLLTSKLEAELDSIERNRFIDALACTSNIELTKMYLQASVSAATSYFNTEAERYRAFSEVAGVNQNSTFIAIKFLKANFDNANTWYGRANINRAITRLASFVVNEDRYKDFADLLADAESKSYIDATTLKSARETIAANQMWIDRNEKIINDWIEKNGSSTKLVSAVLVALAFVALKLI